MDTKVRKKLEPIGYYTECNAINFIYQHSLTGKKYMLKEDLSAKDIANIPLVFGDLPKFERQEMISDLLHGFRPFETVLAYAESIATEVINYVELIDFDQDCFEGLSFEAIEGKETCYA